MRNTLVDIYDLDETLVRTITPDVGGGFGSKHVVYPEEVIVAGAALLYKRPVKWIEKKTVASIFSLPSRNATNIGMSKWPRTRKAACSAYVVP